jgi:hypothetical protein
VVPDTDLISQSFGITQHSILPYDDKNAISERWSVDAAGFPTVRQFNYEQEIDAQVSTDVSVVAHGTALTPDSLTLDYQERKIDAKHKLRIVNRIAALPSAETNYVTQMFTFPALLTSLDFRLAALGIANRSEVQWTAGIRASFTIPAVMNVVTSYYTSRPAPLTPISWAPGDITFKGVSFSISLSNVLYNAWSNIGVTFAGDAQYGNLVDRFSIAATSPSAAGYAAWINTQQCVSSAVSRYKGIWMRKDTFCTMR